MRPIINNRKMNLFKANILLVLVCAIITGSCKRDKVFSRSDYSEYITGEFNSTRILAGKRSNQLFTVLNDSLEEDIKRAMEFYYASMPLSDLADYDGEFFLANVKKTFDAYNDYEWCRTIPEDIFLHFVLPLRVNNENLDHFRINYYAEIRERLRDLDNIEDAALEINHWCHEKVSYQSADIRTSGPESTILSARGRCGEESTFTVAALRTAGIPARQVYVPRWAHSDDNHAWVEVWLDGIWKYLGACEPEPMLNRGWFTGPASRAMLVHTKTFGRYFGSESVVKSLPEYSEINCLHNYAPTRTIELRVIGADSSSLSGAEVVFGQMNYAEFYPLATIISGQDGKCKFTTGNGDIFVWVSLNGNSAFAEIDINDNKPVIVLDKDQLATDKVFTCELSVPPGTRSDAVLADELRDINTMRLKYEDSIRHSYISSWPGDADISAFLNDEDYSIDDFLPLVKTSMGNYNEIFDLLKMLDEGHKKDALAMLRLIAEKDLRDSGAETLFDHIVNARKYYNNEYSEEIFEKYILNPRIANEIIKPWRSYIQNQQDKQTIKAFRESPEILSEWMNENLQPDDERNYYGVPITPRGVLELGVTDTPSRDILFVACCRACGIPARLEPGTGLPQYMAEGKWIDPYFSDRGVIEPRSASISFEWDGTGPEPEYYRNFTLAKIKDGEYKTLEYDYYKKITAFTEPLALSPGLYMLTTCTRPDDSRMLASVSFFELIENESTRLRIEPIHILSDLNELAILQSDSLLSLSGDYVNTEDLLKGQSVFAWIDPGKEPSKHLLNEIQLLKTEFDSWGGSFVFLTEPSVLTPSFNTGLYKNLPENSLFFSDPKYTLLKKTFPDINTDASLLPIVLFVLNDKSVVYRSSGYKIGYGNQVFYLTRNL